MSEPRAQPGPGGPIDLRIRRGALGARFSLRALGGRLGATWERDRRDTLFLMGAIGLSILPHATHLPGWCSAAFAVLFLWRLGLVLSGRWLPRAAVRWVGALAALLAVWAQYGTLLGREPGVALLVLFLGLKLMEMQARRDLFVVIFLCLFLLVTAFFGSQGPGVAAAVLAALVALVAAMLTMHYGAHEQPPLRRVGAALLLVAQALPLAAVMFVAFPRPSQPLWGQADGAASGRTGLSDTMAPGSVARLGLSREVAFRVAFDSRPMPAPALLYWRGPTLGLYDGRTWRAGRDAVAPAPRPEIRAAAAGAPIAYTVLAEPSQRGELYALERLAEVPMLAGHDVSVTAEFGVLVSPPLARPSAWHGAALPDAAVGLNETTLSLQSWLQVPPGFNPRTHALAAGWRATEDDPRRLVARALAMFAGQGFSYTLSPPPLGRHAVDEFLFDTRAGFCEHYASAFVVLMRILDVPARVVTGYQGGEPDAAGGWLVRQADAHAWAEVWLAGRGWVRIDPTAAIAPDRIERGVRAPQPEAGGEPGDGLGLAALWQEGLAGLAERWQRWLVGYDHAHQLRLLQKLGLPVHDWVQLAGVFALALLVPLGAVALLTLRPRLPADPLDRAWQAFCDKLAAAGIQRQPHDTPNRLLAQASPVLAGDDAREQARAIVERYNRLRYDSPRPSPDSMRQLRRLIDAFEP